MSIRPWPSAAAVEAWRADPGFRERVVRLPELLESCEPRTLDPILEVLESGEVHVQGEVEAEA